MQHQLKAITYKAVNRDTVLQALLQEGRGVALQGEAVEAAHGAVLGASAGAAQSGHGHTYRVGVAGGEDGGAQQGVDDVRQHANTHVGHGNDVGRAVGGSGAGSVELGVGVGQDDADAEGADDEEEAEAPVDGLEAGLEVTAGVLGLAGDHGTSFTIRSPKASGGGAVAQVFGSHNGEEGGAHGAHEAVEAAHGARVEVLGERARVAPVAEAVGVALGVAADHGHEREGEDDQDEDDLASGEPELGLTCWG